MICLHINPAFGSADAHGKLIALLADGCFICIAVSRGIAGPGGMAACAVWAAAAVRAALPLAAAAAAAAVAHCLPSAALPGPQPQLDDKHICFRYADGSLRVLPVVDVDGVAP